MKLRILIPSIVAVVLLNLFIQHCIVRWDMTDDKRYSLSVPTKTLLQQLDAPVDVTLLLNGDLNAGFTRLKHATEEFVEELNIYADISVRLHHSDDIPTGLEPVVIHERTTQGQMKQTTVYPYAIVRYKDKTKSINLLRNNRGLSGEENLNLSIENLEFAFIETLRSLSQEKIEKVAFLEGHGELPEANVYDLSQSLSRYYQIDRGVLGNEAGVLDDYQVVIIADPQQPFSENDKYILDQYLMQGGRLLWVLNGVQFSTNSLSEDGMTPIIPLELNLSDMLFRYGVRINPVLVQDLQCLPVPVDVSTDPQQPNWQPVPWTYAPLLLTSQTSAITRGLMQVSATMASNVEAVGGDDGIQKDILLATSSASKITGTPARVDLSMNSDEAEFQYAHIPVAMSMEGEFSSFFAHQMQPENISSHTALQKKSVHTKQVVVASGSIIRNEWQQGSPLPLGYDRYTRTRFGNRDFLINAILYLTDDTGWMNLRQKEVALRLINEQRARDGLIMARTVSIVVPLMLLLAVGGCVLLVRRHYFIR